MCGVKPELAVFLPSSLFAEASKDVDKNKDQLRAGLNSGYLGDDPGLKVNYKSLPSTRNTSGFHHHPCAGLRPGAQVLAQNLIKQTFFNKKKT